MPLENRQARFHFIVVVWGESYTNLFLEIIVPNYLSPNNLPTCSEYGSLHFKIYTRPEDVERIQQHQSYLALADEVETEFIPALTADLFKGRNKYSLKGICQSMAIQDALSLNAVVVLLNPDSLISDGGLARCCDLIGKGKKVVLVFELARAQLETVIPIVSRNFYDPHTNVLTLPNRRLVEVGVNNLHPIGQILFWKDKPFSKWPSAIYWRVGKSSLLAKVFHLHPLAIDLRGMRVEVPATLMPDDAGLLEFLRITSDTIHVVTDSDEIVCIELSSRDMDPLSSIPLETYSKTISVLNWARMRTLPRHRASFINFNIRFQSEESIDWKKAESQVAADTWLIRLLLPLITFSERPIMMIRLRIMRELSRLKHRAKSLLR